MPARRTTSRRNARGVPIRAGGAPPPPPANFPNKRSSGVFSAPADATAIDWAVINGGGGPHWIRVTVSRCPVGAPKIAIAGPTSVFLDTTRTTHLAVPLSARNKCVYYEVLVEDEDLQMHPSVQLFRKYPTEVIAGTLITPGDFVQTGT